MPVRCDQLLDGPGEHAAGRRRSSPRGRRPAARRRAGGWRTAPRCRSRRAGRRGRASPRGRRGRGPRSARRAAPARGRRPAPGPAWPAGACRWRSRRRAGTGPRPGRPGRARRTPAGGPRAAAARPARPTWRRGRRPSGRWAGSRARACSPAGGGSPTGSSATRWPSDLDGARRSGSSARAGAGTASSCRPRWRPTSPTEPRGTSTVSPAARWSPRRRCASAPGSGAGCRSWPAGGARGSSSTVEMGPG